MLEAIHLRFSELVGAKRKATYRRKGNQCRDARDWVGAAKAYRQMSI